MALPARHPCASVRGLSPWGDIPEEPGLRHIGRPLCAAHPAGGAVPEPRARRGRHADSLAPGCRCPAVSAPRSARKPAAPAGPRRAQRGLATARRDRRGGDRNEPRRAGHPCEQPPGRHHQSEASRLGRCRPVRPIERVRTAPGSLLLRLPAARARGRRRPVLQPSDPDPGLQRRDRNAADDGQRTRGERRDLAPRLPDRGARPDPAYFFAAPAPSRCTKNASVR